MSQMQNTIDNLLLREGGYPHLPKREQSAPAITFKASLFGYCYKHDTSFLGACTTCCINKANELDDDRQ